MTKQKRKPEKKHKCSFCSKPFWNKQDRVGHENKMHFFRTPYSCDYIGCNKKFYAVNSKCRHLRMCHKEWYQRNKQNGIKLVHDNPKEPINRNNQQQQMIKKEKYNKGNVKSPNKSCNKSNHKSDNEKKCDISENEIREMQKICNQLELKKYVHIHVALYAYSSHLAVYKDIVKIVEITDNDEQKRKVHTLSANKLRDIKSKIGSEGKCGRKPEMIEGIIKMLPQLQSSMLKNGNTTNNINNIENRMESGHVQENNINCDASPNITSNRNNGDIKNDNDDSTMSTKRQLDQERYDGIPIEPSCKKRKLNVNV